MSSPQRKRPPSSAKLKGARIRPQGHSTLDAQEVKARACGHWLAILSALAPSFDAAIARPGHHVACPVHGGKDGFRLHRDAAEIGGGICNTCGSFPDGLALLMWANGWMFLEALREVAAWLGMTGEAPVGSWKAPNRPAPVIRTPKINQRATVAIHEAWRESVSLSDPAAAVARVYLSKARALGDLPWDEIGSLRFLPALDLWEQGDEGPVKVGTYPAIVARIDNPAGELVSLHRIYLRPDGSGKVARKKAASPYHGITKGGAIRLFPVAKRLGVAEGIETALAAWVLSGGRIPVWSAIDAGGLEAIELPRQVGEVLIFADRDLPSKEHPHGRGQEAAINLARRMLAEGCTVKRIPPPESYGAKADWNDVLTQQGGIDHAG